MPGTFYLHSLLIYSNNEDNSMSWLARTSLLGAFAVATFGFAMTGIFLGPELPAGATPFYVLASICGVLGILVWSPWNAAGRAEVLQEIAETEPDESAGPGDIDLTKLSAAGCLLYLVSGIGALSVALVIGLSIPEVERNRRTIRTAGAVALAVAGGIFFGGRWGLQQLGIPLVKQPLKKSATKKKLATKRSASQVSPVRRKKLPPPD